MGGDETRPEDAPTAPPPAEQPAPPAESEPVLCEQECYARAKDKGYSLRRALYVGCTTAFCLVVSAVLVFMGYSGPLAETYVRELISLASTICVLYMGAGVLDRSQILHRIGDSFSRGGGSGWRRDSEGDAPQKETR